MEFSRVIEQINRLYISYRKKLIYQYKKPDGFVGYSTYPSKRKEVEGKYYLTDSWVKRHLEGEITLGLLAGESNYTKFLCFDVDTKEKSEAHARHIVEVMEDFNIRREDIHVSVSGNKGYHIELFFDDIVSVKRLEIFYRRVLEETGLSVGEVEFRPLRTLGVKLPLGKHQKTGRRCWYVNTDTWREIEDYNYLEGVTPLDSEVFLMEQCDMYYEEFIKAMEITETETVEVQRVVEQLNLDDVAKEGIKTTLREILEENLLSYPDSRNKYTLFLSMYLRDLGKSSTETEAIILSVMLNTLRERPDFIDSSEDVIKRETAKVVYHTYQKGYTLTGRKLNVRLYKEEIDAVLNLKSLPLKKLYLSMLIHSKSVVEDYEEFYMAYSVMERMGNNGRRSALKNYVDKLRDVGLVDVISRNKLADERYRTNGLGYYKQANRYKIKKISNLDGDYIEIRELDDLNIEIELIKVLNKFYSLEELKKKLTRDQFSKVKLGRISS